MSERDGGRKSEELVLLGAGVSLCDLDGGGVGLEACGASAWVSFSRLMSGLTSFELLPMPQCWASRDLLSSIGVKILRDLAAPGFCSRFDWSS